MTPPIRPLNDIRETGAAYITEHELSALLDLADALIRLCETDPTHDRRHNPHHPHGLAHIKAEQALSRFPITDSTQSLNYPLSHYLTKYKR